MKGSVGSITQIKPKTVGDGEELFVDDGERLQVAVVVVVVTINGEFEENIATLVELVKICCYKPPCLNRRTDLL
jgi:hypothetical protein